MLKSICLFSIIFFLMLPGFSSPLKSLTIGDSVPDDLLTNVIKYDKTTIRLSDFRGKLVILDFWGVYCASCIESMPYMQKLQEELKDKIQVLIITNDKQEVVDKLMKRSAIARNCTLPMVIEDSILVKYFPYFGLPFHVWIDQNGIVNQIPSPGNTTIENIKKQLAGNKLYFPISGIFEEFDEPFSVIESTKNDPTIYYSYLRRFINGGIVGTGIDYDKSTNTVVGFHASRRTILDLLKIAYFRNHVADEIPDNKVIFENLEREQFVSPKDNGQVMDWSRENAYGYFLRVPANNSHKLYDFMQQDMIRLFGLQGSLEERKVRCLVLMKVGKEDRLKTKGGTILNECVDSVECKTRLFRNVSISLLVNLIRFNLRELDLPFIDGTGYIDNIDITINNYFKNMDELKHALKKYGLDIVEEERNVEMLIIRKI